MQGKISLTPQEILKKDLKEKVLEQTQIASIAYCVLFAQSIGIISMISFSQFIIEAG